MPGQAFRILGDWGP